MTYTGDEWRGYDLEVGLSRFALLLLHCFYSASLACHFFLVMASEKCPFLTPFLVLNVWSLIYILKVPAIAYVIPE